jgi:hypothetical protein
VNTVTSQMYTHFGTGMNERESGILEFGRTPWLCASFRPSCSACPTATGIQQFPMCTAFLLQELKLFHCACRLLELKSCKQSGHNCLCCCNQGSCLEVLGIFCGV